MFTLPFLTIVLFVTVETATFISGILLSKKIITILPVCYLTFNIQPLCLLCYYFCASLTVSIFYIIQDLTLTTIQSGFIFARILSSLL